MSIAYALGYMAMSNQLEKLAAPIPLPSRTLAPVMDELSALARRAGKSVALGGGSSAPTVGQRIRSGVDAGSTGQIHEELSRLWAQHHPNSGGISLKPLRSNAKADDLTRRWNARSELRQVTPDMYTKMPHDMQRRYTEMSMQAPLGDKWRARTLSGASTGGVRPAEAARAPLQDTSMKLRNAPGGMVGFDDLLG